MTWTASISVLDLCVGLHLCFDDLDGDGIGNEIRLCMPSTGEVQQLRIVSVSDSQLIVRDWYDRTWKLTPRSPVTFMVKSPMSLLPANWVIRAEL